MFKNAVDLFEVFGFRIRVDPSWLVLAALVVWSLSTSYFPENLPGLGRFDYIGLSIAAMLGLFGSLILHEVAHSLVARQFKLNVGSITLFIFGGVAELEQDPKSAKSEFWIAIAGPVMSFALAAVFAALSNALTSVGVSEPIHELFDYLSFINLVLALFNLIPAFPTDGGRIFRAALWAITANLMRATRIASWVGKFFSLLLIVTGIIALFEGQFISGFWLMIIGFFLITASAMTYEQLLVQQLLKDQTVQSLMTEAVWTADVNENVETLVNDIMLGKNVSFVPVLEGDHLLGCVDAAMVQNIDRENWADTHLNDILIASNSTNTISPNTPTEKVFGIMAHKGQRKLMVSEDGRLLGVITLSDLMSYLAIRRGFDETDLKTSSTRKDKSVHA